MLSKVLQTDIYIFFRVSIVIKLIQSLFEILFGLLFFFIQKGKAVAFIAALSSEEIGEDSKDFIASHLLFYIKNLTSSGQFFASFYLLSHGIIKGTLLIGLYKKRKEVYPIAIAIFSLFIGYEMYRYTHTHSPWLILFMFFDSIFISVTWYEYTLVHKKKKIVS